MIDSKKRLGFAALCLLLSAAALPAYSAEAPVSPALCVASGGAEIVFKTDTMSCGGSFCFNDDQCWERCTQATSAACVSGTCQYTLPGGGGSGSGGQCPQQRFCQNNSQCAYSLFGIQGTCTGGTCHC
jgi:hypothetical protein